MTGWRTAWTLARRGLDWRFRGLRLLVVCIVLGTAALAAIGTLTGAIERELAERGQVLLGGDVEVQIPLRAASPDELAEFRSFGPVSSGMRMQAMARRTGTAGESVVATPVALKQVDGNWPLYGTLRLKGGRVAGAPAGMDAWIDPGVGERLGLKTGDTFAIGKARLTVGGVIASESDRLSEGFSLGPTVIIGKAALDTSGLVQPGSMVRSKYRIKLPPGSDPKAVEAAIKTKFPDAALGTRTRDAASPGLDRFVGRMGQFLLLVALAALAIAGIGIGNGVSGYLEARRGSIATLKVLGATSGDIARIFLLQIAVTALVSVIAGLAIGLAVTPLLGLALKGLLPVAPGFVFDGVALATAAAFGLLIALTFAAPPLVRAREFPAMALMRARVSPLSARWRPLLLPVGLGLAGIVALAVLTAPQKLLAAGFLGGAAALFFLLLALGRAVTWAAARAARPKNTVLRLALANLHRPGAQTGPLVVALGFGLAAFVLIAAIQTSLDGNIARRVPTRAPDYFVLDVPKDKAAQFEQAVRGAAPRAAIRTVPALRGSILAFGPKDRMTVVAQMGKISDGAWALRGDRGLTYSADVPEGNTVTQGKWWPKDYTGEPLVSVDENLAKAIGLSIGDYIRFTFLGVERTARVASFRRIDWDSLGFNYVLVFSPNTLEDAPHNLAATIELPAGEKGSGTKAAILSALVRQFPSSSVIEVGPVIGQARTILSQMGTAILAAASVAILAGLAVLAGAIAAAREARTYDNVILRVLGASRRQLITLLLSEYTLLVAVTSAIALALGTGAAWLVVTRLFDFEWMPGWPRVLGVLGAGAALVLILAVTGSLGVLRSRPARVLREL
ncbi:FtsX-like permease family protein [Novosphingobium sp. ZN18A2]|uniref:ABC transporter permease n=1 Tax=Novosphingobium sp. ZN18A2 TaxID=3079861 RepID=UPI0030CC9B7F